ncbi:MAG TPA: alpha-1,4-glucan--maltose-1-phosphate maltosyltransferase [Longimicrobiales bacterium]|nr:alpha-1,4-glucan--maltose-1-phosphate maltosyltransferase [Longimicrobiales bacterium]
MDRRRVIVEGVRPEIDGGRFPIKRVTGDEVAVEADVFTDGHDQVSARLLWRHEKQRVWREVRMSPLGNDRWRAAFTVDALGRYRYSVEGWVDHFKTWRDDLVKRVAADQDVSVDLLIGAGWIEQAAERARSRDAAALRRWARSLRMEDVAYTERARAALQPELSDLMAAYPDLAHATAWEHELEVLVEPVRARFSAWYELFPRSAGETPGAHGTFRDVEARLSYISELGFDTLYLPPVHPIGTTRRKGRNNAVEAEPEDVGSPWGIGSEEGGHKAIHPRLGTIEDFRRLVASARELGMEVALDIAFQVSPDHPYVREHPEWFQARPDGTVQYAENPPKKYQDIYPFDFESDNWTALWRELESVFRYWIEQGVRTFRVDNPHTKPFPFWEWLIRQIKARDPDIVFLSEAFTSPRRMYRLAKLGFTQSYTYFAWRNDKAELEKYLRELTRSDVTEYFRPNFWPNTPDILTEYLQTGGRPAFMSRVVLAATLTANYGIYGPAYELMEHLPRDPGSEEYLDSEKYQIREWPLTRPDSLRFFIARLNRVRRENPALQDDRTLRFHRIDSERLIAYSKASGSAPVHSLNPYGDTLGEPHVTPRAGSPENNVILTVVNLDPRGTHSGWVELPLAELGISPHRPFEAHDLLSDARYTWNGAWNYVELNPHVVPAHVFRLTQAADPRKE